MDTDLQALQKTTRLMEYFSEITAAFERDPLRDILSDEAGAPDLIIWLDRLPDGVKLVLNSHDDVVLRIRPERFMPEPLPPEVLFGWIDSEQPRGVEGPEPGLRAARGEVDSPDGHVQPRAEVLHAFTRWHSQWTSWRRDQRRIQARRALYENLEQAAKTLEQHDDEYELVLGLGLLRWQAPDGEAIRRHLLTEVVSPRLDRVTAEVSVSLMSGRRRLEDRVILGDQDGYQPDRGHALRREVCDADASPLRLELMSQLHALLADCLDVPVHPADPRDSVTGPLPSTPMLSASPALIVRRRSRTLLAETFRKIVEALREPGASVPVGLAQLVVDTEAEQRNRWLQAQGALSGDVLGVDPLFPLSANSEQMHVMDLLRTETCVVVQGPPGTGKTHTIANLVSALLARGQRVLVTSQKDQALRVLRDRIPPDLRDLCVLLTGGSKDAATELKRGLDALSAAVASPTKAALAERIEGLTEQRHVLRSRAAQLNHEVAQLRGIEQLSYEAVAPAYSRDRYRGTLGEIVRDVKSYEAQHGWIPQVDADLPDAPPLSDADALEMLRLMRSDDSARRGRAHQRLPEPGDLPSPAVMAELIIAERDARAKVEHHGTELSRRLAAAGVEVLDNLDLLGRQFHAVATRLGLSQTPGSEPAAGWVRRAAGDLLAGRHRGLWGQLAPILGHAQRIQDRLGARGVGPDVQMPPVGELGIGTARGMLEAGRELREHLARGKKLRAVLPPEGPQKRASQLLEQVRVDGKPPDTLARLDAALEYLEAQVAAAQLVRKWAEAQVIIPDGGLAATLSELQDADRTLSDVLRLADVHARLTELLTRSGLSVKLTTVAAVTFVLQAVPAARQHLELRRARTAVDTLHHTIHQQAFRPDSCPELLLLADAVRDRDTNAYQRALIAIETARAETAAEHRRAALAQVVHTAHPRLYELVNSSVEDPAWEDRLGNLAAAWAWSKAEQFVRRQRNAEQERRLTAQFDETEDQIRRVTEQLAAAQAMRACLDRMTDTHARALRSYREHMSHVGAGGGRKTREFRRAARAAMEKAKAAVPAWVVPLPNLLENIVPAPDAFDVVIVDEASQVGLEFLFLLWMAPRVIVVGDDKQCTPADNRMGMNLDDLFRTRREHLGDIDDDIGYHFTPKSNLYGLMSARSGKDAVVRLREHFRSMPEIINWSSNMFYSDGATRLIPLRDRTSRDLEPLRLVHITDAYPERTGSKVRNPVEAKRIVAQMLDCLTDPRYHGKTFGIIVLQGTDQIKLLEHEINAAISAEDRAARKIRVGTPPDFQGDERSVIFLSSVVTGTPRRVYAGYEEWYNVAATRAEDQMWLFTSVAPADYKPGDLRGSLAAYMLDPPSIYGSSPELATVSDTQPCEPFESLFEQRVYRAIKQRRYNVIPQVPVGTRRLDLVIVGAGGRLAVECDGHHWHASPDAVASDARRDRELRRMGWEVVRIRESEFEFDQDHELSVVWQRLEDRDIHPVDVRNDVASSVATEDPPPRDEGLDL